MTIDFSCVGCRYPFRVPDSLAGKKGKCPKCGTISDIPITSIAVAPVMGGPPPFRPGPPPLNGPDARGGPDDYDVRRPRRRKKKSKLALILGLSIGGVVLLAGIGFGLLFFLGGGLGDELKFLPENCQAVASFRPAEFYDSSLWKEMKSEFKGANDPEQATKDSLGVSPKDIDRVILGFDGENSVLIVKMRKTITAKEAEKALKTSVLGGGSFSFSESKVGNYVMNKTDKDDAPAYSVVGGNLVVASRRAKFLEGILKRDKKAEFTKSFQELMNKADFSATFTRVQGKPSSKKAGFFPMGDLTVFGAAQASAPAAFLGMDPGNDGEGTYGHVKIGSGFSVSMTKVFSDSSTAQKEKEKFDREREQARNHLKGDELDLFKQIKMWQKDNNVTVSFSISMSQMRRMKGF